MPADSSALTQAFGWFLLNCQMQRELTLYRLREPLFALSEKPPVIVNSTDEKGKHRLGLVWEVFSEARERLQRGRLCERGSGKGSSHFCSAWGSVSVHSGSSVVYLGGRASHSQLPGFDSDFCLKIGTAHFQGTQRVWAKSMLAVASMD